MLVDDTHALMTRKEFEALHDYSCSIPTGTTIGKRWRSSDAYDPARDKGGPRHGLPLRWMLGEYTASPRPGEVRILWRHIIIEEGA